MSVFSRTEKIGSGVLDHAFHRIFLASIHTQPAFALGAPGLLVLLTPPAQSAEDFEPSATVYLNENLEASSSLTSGYLLVAAKDKPERIKASFQSACFPKRRAIVISETPILPTEILVAADATVQMESVTPADLREACRTALDLSITTGQASRLLTYPRDIMVSALRRDRPISDSLQRLKRFAPETTRVVPSIESSPRLDELHGYGEAKQWGLQLADDLKRWKRGSLKWSDVDRGLLVSGPPGVGKTVFAKALAATCEVNFVATSLSQWQAKGSLNDLLKAMRSDFQAAANEAPSIIFIDELDSVGSREAFSGDYANYSVQVVNALLECLDGAASRDGVVVVGATNHPDKIDPAVLRPGRLDRHVAIKLPSEEDRLAILRQLLGRDLTFDIRELGPQTEGMAGADLAQLVRDGKKNARREARALKLTDLSATLPEMLHVVGEYRRCVAIHEAGHTIVGTVIDYGKFLGAFIRNQLNPRFRTQSAGSAVFERPMNLFGNAQQYRDEICILLSGMAAERLVLGSHGHGSGAGRDSDLAAATDLALLMETKLGMGNRLLQLGTGTAWDAIGNQQVPWLVDRVDSILSEEMKRSEEILREQKTLLLKVVNDLYEHGCMSPARLDELRRETSNLKRPNIYPSTRKSRTTRSTKQEIRS
ncbi:AAA family ATPase [Aliirhizobium cellulosilyticum]|uniref:ATP-dependent Zn protease n=1 Tax=Aliirhizobium cellulosilyticum TaxID=393664 RepID=A0A7W6V0N1_9HYPH|nr:AAA family ATPase [Rhizobium cellulosilyticum]MBB4349438.1 ATP-dependent Zn protease [Rhizobium cellulosilyticum]MBB4412340.1 ATP-dependent Zn protease [Rhizobium cellulosilyticum]MBB4446971.1 ATP-dependent Zn protease [Rhizobium cellulosilyticum]